MMKFIKAITLMCVAAVAWLLFMAFVVGPLFPPSSDLPSWMLLGGFAGIAWETIKSITKDEGAI